MTSLDFDRKMIKRDGLTILLSLNLKDDNLQGHAPLLICSFPFLQLAPLV